ADDRWRVASAGLLRLLQVIVDGGGRRLIRRRTPLRAHERSGFAGGALRRRDHADEIAIPDDDDPWNLLRGAVVDGEERSRVAIGSNNPAVQHRRPDDVWRVLMATGDEIAAVDFLWRCTAHGPLCSRREHRLAGDGAGQLLTLRQLSVLDGLPTG